MERLAGGIHICLAVCLPSNLWMEKQIVFMKMEGQVEMFVEGWLYYILYGYINRPGDLFLPGWTVMEALFIGKPLGFSWEQI